MHTIHLYLAQAVAVFRRAATVLNLASAHFLGKYAYKMVAALAKSGLLTKNGVFSLW